MPLNSRVDTRLADCYDAGTPLALSPSSANHHGENPLARRTRRPLGPLDLRSQAILRAVIEEYVTTAQPVGSQALVERYGLGVSSATVRNILAELEAAGLLTHPHTRAGRVPTDAGLPLLRRVDRRDRARCRPSSS